MFLSVPRIKQRNSVTCLPACAWSVLSFHGYQVDYDEIEEACLLSERGAAVELGMQGLREQGWDVSVLDEFDLPTIRASLEDETPVIAAFAQGHFGLDSFAQAVVVCGLDDRFLTVMDPLIGDFVHLPLEQVREQLAVEFQGGFFIAGAPEQ